MRVLRVGAPSPDVSVQPGRGSRYREVPRYRGRPVHDVAAGTPRRSSGMKPAALCVAVSLWFATTAQPQTQSAAAPAPVAPANRQLVVPFENVSRTPRVIWLSEGSAVLLTDDLQALGVPAISRDDRRRAFDRLRVPAVASLSHATVIRLGQVVGAAQVIVGSFDLDRKSV